MRHVNLGEWLVMAESIAKNYGGRVDQGEIHLGTEGVLGRWPVGVAVSPFDVSIELRGADDTPGTMLVVGRVSSPPHHHDPAVTGAICRTVSAVTDRAVVILELLRDIRVEIRAGEYGNVFCDRCGGTGTTRARVGAVPCDVCSGTGARPSTVRPPPPPEGA